jgi:hypothetical protein
LSVHGIFFAKIYKISNPHWARVVGYGSFSLRVIHKEGLCPSSVDINRLMMMMMMMMIHMFAEQVFQYLKNRLEAAKRFSNVSSNLDL